MSLQSLFWLPVDSAESISAQISNLETIRNTFPSSRRLSTEDSLERRITKLSLGYHDSQGKTSLIAVRKVVVVDAVHRNGASLSLQTLERLNYDPETLGDNDSDTLPWFHFSPPVSAGHTSSGHGSQGISARAVRRRDLAAAMYEQCDHSIRVLEGQLRALLQLKMMTLDETTNKSKVDPAITALDQSIIAFRAFRNSFLPSFRQKYLEESTVGGREGSLYGPTVEVQSVEHVVQQEIDRLMNELEKLKQGNGRKM